MQWVGTAGDWQPATSLRDQNWHKDCFMSLSMTRLRWCLLSSDLQMTPNWLSGQFTRGKSYSQRNLDKWPTFVGLWSPTGENSVLLLDGITQWNNTGRGWLSEKQFCRERSQCSCEQQDKHEPAVCPCIKEGQLHSDLLWFLCNCQVQQSSLALAILHLVFVYFWSLQKRTLTFTGVSPLEATKMARIWDTWCTRKSSRSRNSSSWSGEGKRDVFLFTTTVWSEVI